MTQSVRERELEKELTLLRTVLSDLVAADEDFRCKSGALNEDNKHIIYARHRLHHAWDIAKYVLKNPDCKLTPSPDLSKALEALKNANDYFDKRYGHPMMSTEEQRLYTQTREAYNSLKDKAQS